MSAVGRKPIQDIAPLEKNYLQFLDRLVSSPTFDKIKRTKHNDTRRKTLENFQTTTSSYLRRTSSRISVPNSRRLQSPTKRKNKTNKRKNILPQIESFTRNFTFTGYDIDTDVLPQPLSPHQESEEIKYGTKYKDACRKMGVIPVSHIVKKLTQREIRLSGYGLGSKGTRALAVALVGNKAVERLNLSENNIGFKGTSSIAEMITTNESIQELSISSNDIGTEGGCVMCRSLRENNKIRKLDLSGNQLRNPICLQISNMLETNYTLKELYLSHNLIEDPGGMVIGDILGKNDTIEILDLSWNKIRVAGAIGIAFGLSRNNSLKTLNLAWNGFSEKGTTAIGEALAKNGCLQELDLSSNRITMEASAKLMKGFKKNNTLCSLTLCGNPITQKGAVLILKAIEKLENSGLKDIDIRDVCVDGEFLDLLNNIQENRILRVRHGPVVRHVEGIKKRDPSKAFTGDPRALVFGLMEKDSLRVVDLFHRLGGPGNISSVSRDEFKAGILEAGLPVTEAQLDDLVNLMDGDGNGEIELGELIASEKSYKRKQKKLKKLSESRQQEAKLDLLSAFEMNISNTENSETPPRSRKVSPAVMMGNNLLNPSAAVTPRSRKSSAVSMSGDPNRLPKISY